MRLSRPDICASVPIEIHARFDDAGDYTATICACVIIEKVLDTVGYRRIIRCWLVGWLVARAFGWNRGMLME